ncbi:hypothetical protein [Schinkia azotoformans]|uniref:hypothetical protein n=1 Tax=Schinkia azotoformans TaxID=1454 RepID=UPI002DBF85F5|nr:hypothetical protein [Schinkia azotoformans]MEC1722836.1 hypothetical protein [Schinkia azotoformans]MED4414266.1 hypothetical protein [Schinkia azotoformans]
MEKSGFQVNGVDRRGNDITIRCEGVDDKELAHFGGLDIHVKATKMLIGDSQNGMSFPEKEGDYDIGSKVVALYLNEVGELLRNLSFDPEYLDEYSNIDLVKMFLENELKNPAIAKVIEKDNAEILQERKEIEREEKEMWTGFVEGLKNRDM